MATDDDKMSDVKDGRPLPKPRMRSSMAFREDFSSERSSRDGKHDATFNDSQTFGTSRRGHIERDFSRYIADSVKLDNGPPARYQLRAKRMNLDRLSDKDCKLRKFTVGIRDPRLQNRTVLLVGETGSGKSTMINALVNFVMGVRFEDKIWFEIVADKNDRSQSNSQTSAVSVYEVFGFEGKTVPYSLTIIDTPGYGDTRGIEYDLIITRKLKDLFCLPGEVTTIHAVGLVLKATENRLDDRMVYVFNSVTSLFGRDMEQSIVALMTHSQRRKPTLALRALDDAKVKGARDRNNEPLYFLFDNCQKERIEDEGDPERLEHKAFTFSEVGMKDLTEFVEKSKPQSLKTTVELLKERERLEACIQNLKERVGSIETNQEAIKTNKEEMSKCLQDTKKQKTYDFSNRVTYKKKKKIDSWWDNEAVTCNRCEENCHYPGCTWAWDPSWCEVMKNGRCIVCSGKCPVKDHVKKRWRYVTKTRVVNVTKTRSQIKKEVKSDQTEKELSELDKKKKLYLDEAFHHIQKMEGIALNTDSVSTYVNLEFLIQKMKEEGDSEQTQKLELMRDRMDERNKSAARYFTTR